MLSGKLVGLVPLQTTDELSLFKWLNDPRVRKAAGRPNWKPAYSLEQVQDLIGERLAKPTRFDLVVMELSAERPVGMIELTHIDPMSDAAQVSLMWGERTEEDLMREAMLLAVRYAFDSQGLHRIWTRVPVIEKGLTAMLLKIGFKEEGVLREDHFAEGGWKSSVLLSLLSAEAGPC
ncbi:MAG: GNAT family N-acetyltransferase [Euryarchaeota archaeon]|nr:GNAT family N-acetyltransferase [Euryarchaeota archaeon]